MVRAATAFCDRDHSFLCAEGNSSVLVDSVLVCAKVFLQEQFRVPFAKRKLLTMQVLWVSS